MLWSDIILILESDIILIFESDIPRLTELKKHAQGLKML